MDADPSLRQPTHLEQLAEAQFGHLTDAEARLLCAAPKGEIAYCGPSESDDAAGNDPANSDEWPPVREIRAELIRWLCVNRDARNLVDPRGIRVHAARITGKLDLAFMVVPFFLSLIRCTISGDIDLRLVEIPSIDLSGSCFSSLNADHATVKGSVLLHDVLSSGTVQLRVARIGGNLECDGGKFHNPAVVNAPTSGTALRAEAIKVGGVVLLRNGFSAKGRVRLYGAEIGGSLECDGGTFSNPAQPDMANSGMALDAEGAKVGRAALLRNRFAAEGQVRLTGAQIGGNLDCNGGRFENPAAENLAQSGVALNADGAKIAGFVLLGYGFVAEGATRLYGAEIGGGLESLGGKFQNPATVARGSGKALDATAAKVARSVQFRAGFAATGQVFLTGAEIRGKLDCTGASSRIQPRKMSREAALR